MFNNIDYSRGCKKQFRIAETDREVDKIVDEEIDEEADGPETEEMTSPALYVALIFVCTKAANNNENKQYERVCLL